MTHLKGGFLLSRVIVAISALVRPRLQATNHSAEGISLEDLSAMAAHFTELDAAINRIDAALRRRLLMLEGRNMDEWDGKGAHAGAAADGTSHVYGGNPGVLQGMDVSRNPCTTYLQVCELELNMFWGPFASLGWA